MAIVESKNHSDFIRLWTAACAAENYNKQAWMDVEGQLAKCGAIHATRKARLRLNPFFCRTEGMRRLSIAVSVVVLVGWAWFVAAVSNGFAKDDGAAIALVVYPIAVYLALLAGRSLFKWVVFGFRIERP